jgi:hypothetical protein
MSDLIQGNQVRTRCVYIGHAMRRLTKHEELFR